MKHSRKVLKTPINGQTHLDMDITIRSGSIAGNREVSMAHTLPSCPNDSPIAGMPTMMPKGTNEKMKGMMNCEEVLSLNCKFVAIYLYLSRSSFMFFSRTGRGQDNSNI